MEFAISNKKDDKVVLNAGQQKAVDNLIDFIASPFDKSRYIQALCGAGGVGKTFVTKYVMLHCKYTMSAIVCAAPTHKACRVLANATGHNVDTIQKLFGFRLDVNIDDFDPNNPAFKPIGSIKFNGLQTRVLIIDESSMLNRALVNYICNYCRKQEIKVIFIGDDAQLFPVKEGQSYAFKIAYKINRLTEIVRQEDDNPIRELLDILRIDIKNNTYNFLSYICNHRKNVVDNKGYIVVNKPEFRQLVSRGFLDKDFEKNVDLYRLVAYTNDAVTSWNSYIRNGTIKNAERNILNNNDLLMSYTTIVDEFNDIIINNSEDYIVRDILNYVDQDYAFKGYMIKFQAIHGGGITKPLFVINHNDPYTFNTYIQELNSLLNEAKTATSYDRSSKWKKYFEFKRKYLILCNVKNVLGEVIYTRDIDYGFAITAHKA